MLIYALNFRAVAPIRKLFRFSPMRWLIGGKFPNQGKKGRLFCESGRNNMRVVWSRVYIFQSNDLIKVINSILIMRQIYSFAIAEQ